MRNIKLVVQYEGGRYQGWQKQTGGVNTIQGKLEVLLEKMCGHPVELHGSGRTDAGVHALAQVANFHTNSQMPVSEMLTYMNEYLPEDIGITSVEEVSPRFHSRLNAKGKRYCYRVLNSAIPHVFDRRYVLEHPKQLDVALMRMAAGLFVGTHDFKAFTSTKKGKKSTVRNIEALDISVIGEELRFTFSGDGFLYHMIRIMMGTLLEVGRHEREIGTIPALLESGNRQEAGELVQAKGLTLVEVRY